MVRSTCHASSCAREISHRWLSPSSCRSPSHACAGCVQRLCCSVFGGPVLVSPAGRQEVAAARTALARGSTLGDDERASLGSAAESTGGGTGFATAGRTLLCRCRQLCRPTRHHPVRS